MAAKNARDLAEYQSDHDLLVTLNERMANLSIQVQAVVSSSKVLTDDHEHRIRILEQQRWVIIGIATAVSFVIPFVLKFVFKV